MTPNRACGEGRRHPFVALKQRGERAVALIGFRPTKINQQAAMKITAQQFRVLVSKDPDWAGKLKSPVEVVDACCMQNHPIRKLSPFLYFSARKDGWSADFSRCADLEKAEGRFAGFVDFWGAGIREIGQLDIRGVDRTGWAACFFRCKNLRIAVGKFPGFVDFADSGVIRVSELYVDGTDLRGYKVGFGGCRVESVRGTNVVPEECRDTPAEIRELFRRWHRGRALLKMLRSRPRTQLEL